MQCWIGRVSLSATGFYKTPDINWDGAKTCAARPFFYFSFGAAIAEVAVDTLTGEIRVLRADLVQDCGRPLNPRWTWVRSRAASCKGWLARA